MFTNTAAPYAYRVSGSIKATSCSDGKPGGHLLLGQDLFGCWNGVLVGAGTCCFFLVKEEPEVALNFDSGTIGN